MIDKGIRRSMVIYRRWNINGVDREIASVADYVESVAHAIGSLGLSNKLLVFSYPLSIGRSDSGHHNAILELLDPNELHTRVAGGCCVISHCRVMPIQEPPE